MRSQANAHAFFRLFYFAQLTAFTTGIPAKASSEFFALDLTEFDVPEGATIYHVAVTPEYAGPGSVAIVDNMQLKVPFPNDRTTLYLGLLPAPLEPAGVSMHVFVAWSLQASFSLSRLSEGFAHLAAGRYSEAVVSGNVAVEHSVSALLREQLPQHIGSAATESAASSSLQMRLDVVVPLWSEAAGLPRLPDPVPEKLRRLRKLRNEVAHGKEISLDEDEVSDLLAAAAVVTSFFTSLNIELGSAYNW